MSIIMYDNYILTVSVVYLLYAPHYYISFVCMSLHAVTKSQYDNYILTVSVVYLLYAPHYCTLFHIDYYILSFMLFYYCMFFVYCIINAIW